MDTRFIMAVSTAILKGRVMETGTYVLYTRGQRIHNKGYARILSIVRLRFIEAKCKNVDLEVRHLRCVRVYII
jgi:hypothetical protein